MKKLSLVIALFIFNIYGCSSPTPLGPVLYEFEFPVDSAETTNKVFAKQLQVGPNKSKVQVDIQWTSKVDADGCSKISGVKITRLGEDKNSVIRSVSHSVFPCGSSSKDEPKTQSILLKIYSESASLTATENIIDTPIIMGNGLLDFKESSKPE